MRTCRSCAASWGATPANGSRPSVAWAIGWPRDRPDATEVIEPEAPVPLEPTSRSRPPAPESRLLRRTRRQLVLWSAGSTLLVLLLLGTLLYAALASQLTAAAQQQLRDRANALSAGAERIGAGRGPFGPRDFGITRDPGSPGLLFGGPSSGTVAAVIPPSVDLSTANVFDQAGAEAARSG